jgi:hypothetical protein
VVRVAVKVVRVKARAKAKEIKARRNLQPVRVTVFGTRECASSDLTALLSITALLLMLLLLPCRKP